MGNNDLRDFIIFVLTFVVVVVCYYIFWVVPYHEALNQTMDCMTEMGGVTEEDWNICAERIRR